MNKELSSITYELVDRLVTLTDVTDPCKVDKETVELMTTWIGIVAEAKIERLRNVLRDESN